VVRHPTQAGFIVLFGTGSYFQSGEGVPTGQDDQAFYGIWDDLSSKPPGTDSKRTLLSQAVNAEIEEGSYEYRVTSDLAIDWGAHSGWYIPLKSPLHGNLGERQIADSIVRGERVIFTTLLPNPDACGFGGSGWLMELGWVNGGRLPTDAAPFLFRTQVGDTHEYAAVTLDHDGKPGTGKVAPSGRKSSVGIVPTPAVLSRAGAQREFKYLSGSELLAGSQRKVNIEVVNESAESSSAGRRAWSQLFK
jgi:type IV pilus assembly protein PilY1